MFARSMLAPAVAARRCGEERLEFYRQVLINKVPYAAIPIQHNAPFVPGWHFGAAAVQGIMHVEYYYIPAYTHTPS